MVSRFNQLLYGDIETVCSLLQGDNPMPDVDELGAAVTNAFKCLLQQDHRLGQAIVTCLEGQHDFVLSWTAEVRAATKTFLLQPAPEDDDG